MINKFSVADVFTGKTSAADATADILGREVFEAKLEAAVIEAQREKEFMEFLESLLEEDAERLLTTMQDRGMIESWHKV